MASSGSGKAKKGRYVSVGEREGRTDATLLGPKAARKLRRRALEAADRDRGPGPR